MIHPASRLEVVAHSRADGRSAVKTAAYCARTSWRDERTGRRFRAGKKGGLLSHELINWDGDAAALWNCAEMAETRSNARVIRELRPSLPAELPLAEQVRLVRGFSLWLRDEYGVAVQADIHAPSFLHGVEERLHQAGKLEMGHEEYLEALSDPARTNRNFHAHILMTTREVCPLTGAFGAKTRSLDDRETGPQEILRMRQEWEKRTNAALKRIGSNVWIDLRSYKTMAAAGDAPEGLIAQDHLGPRRAARSRRLQEEGEDKSRAGRRRKAIQAHNKTTWQSWMVLRALEREKSRGAAEAIARDREAARKKEADAERHRLQNIQSAQEAEVAISQASQFDSLKTGSPLAQAISWALQETDEPASEDSGEFSSEVDLETYEPPPGPPPPEPVLEVKRVRVRGQRSR
ncbi:MobA/MobL family protein [Rhodobacteraceae bacterium R_SAG2]|nr:MobA/MobL family protein [Rhodobacteraceae bacterium R_SAG2]NKX41371.1 MobA/MobL family protein [Rhodobacteraceae bacterium R_SAG2]